MKGVLSAALGSRLAADRRGVAAVEFAMTVPVLIMVYIAGFEVSQAMATYRKVSDTTIELANIAAQYTTIGTADSTSIMNASSQIMAPYSTQNLTIVLSEITTDANNNAKVTWSEPYNGATALPQNSAITLPSGLATPNTNYILIQTTYLYNPVTGTTLVPSIPMTDQIYMLPRASPSIPFTG